MVLLRVSTTAARMETVGRYAGKLQGSIPTPVQCAGGREIVHAAGPSIIGAVAWPPTRDAPERAKRPLPGNSCSRVPWSGRADASEAHKRESIDGSPCRYVPPCKSTYWR